MSKRDASFSDLFVKFITSLRLTIVCLVLGMLLIFFGTLAQVSLGIHQVQAMFFRSWFVWWSPPGAWWGVFLPGGYLVGGVLLVNLIAAHTYRFQLSWRKSGILLVHFGLILLLLGELFTGVLQRDSDMRLTEGETKAYSESDRALELAIIDRSDPATDRVVAIHEGALADGRMIQRPELPFRIQPRAYYANSEIFNRGPQTASLGSPEATQGEGTKYTAREIPRTSKMNERDLTVAWVDLIGPDGLLGTWMVCNAFARPQTFEFAGRTFSLELRLRRYYKPYTVTLLDFSHDRYPGTEIPRNFSSLVRLKDPTRNIDREVLIYMNHPLRHDGLSFFQSGYEGEKTTVLRIVHNPSRLVPYIACALVFFGLAGQFGIHLFGFFRRRAASS